MGIKIHSSEQSIQRRKIDIIMLVALSVLVTFGLVIIISAVSGLPLGHDIIKRHLIALPLSIGAFIFGWMFNYQIYNEQYKAIYAMIIGLLGAVLAFGIVSRGSNSWFNLGIVSLQPAEVCRVATILVVSAFLARAQQQNSKDFRILFGIAALVIPIFLLIMLQPDFSSIVITAPALLILMFAAGVNIFYFVLLFTFAAAAGAFPLLWTYVYIHPGISDGSIFWHVIDQLSHNWLYIAAFCMIVAGAFWAVFAALKRIRIYIPTVLLFIVGASIMTGFFSGLFVNSCMKNYQRKRIETFIAPNADPKGAGYNVKQAQIAMGSGGIFGKGLFSGTQSRLGFVPERHTDFVLAVLGEETGFLGMITVLALYVLILWRTAVIATLASDRYGYLICCGVFGMFLTYMVVNFGMLVGLMPVAGIPLPLISYGGSNLVSSMWAFGIVESVYRRRLSII